MELCLFCHHKTYIERLSIQNSMVQHTPKLNSAFNKRYPNLSVTDYVQVGDGPVGTYHGISTTRKSGEITVLAYHIKGEPSPGKPVYHLPREVRLNGTDLHIEFEISDIPEVKAWVLEKPEAPSQPTSV